LSYPTGQKPWLADAGVNYNFIYAPICCKILNITAESILVLNGVNGPEECLMERLGTEMSNGGVI
jgi:hypothetical protein